MPSLAHSESDVRPGAANRDQQGTWQAELASAIRCPMELCERLGLDPELGKVAYEAGFPTLVPESFFRRMRHGDPTDPLLRQVLPDVAELTEESLPNDAVGDLPASVAPGVLQKYDGRALMILSGQCAVNCRYCFRRHYPYETVSVADGAWDSAIGLLHADPTIEEVILSGGDPLTLGDQRLGRLFERLAEVGSLKRIRIHTRLPVVIPSRVTERLASLLSSCLPKCVVVLHVNHANEIDGSVELAVRRLAAAGAMLLNQSVLLRGVNDSVCRLAALSNRLIEIGVVPYYLHRVDRVAGVSHFEVAESEGVALVQELRTILPGYAVPRFVREDVGHAAKTVLA